MTSKHQEDNYSLMVAFRCGILVLLSGVSIKYCWVGYSKVEGRVNEAVKQ